MTNWNLIFHNQLKAFWGKYPRPGLNILGSKSYDDWMPPRNIAAEKVSLWGLGTNLSRNGSKASWVLQFLVEAPPCSASGRKFLKLGWGSNKLANLRRCVYAYNKPGKLACGVYQTFNFPRLSLWAVSSSRLRHLGTQTCYKFLPFWTKWQDYLVPLGNLG